MKDKFILDSSIWIAVERKKQTVCDRVLPLIAKNQVCLVDLIAAEVLRGGRTARDFDRLRETFLNFRILKTSWLRVATLAFQVAKQGFQPPLADLYIAQCTIEGRRTLITQDKDFQSIAKAHPFVLELIA